MLYRQRKSYFCINLTWKIDYYDMRCRLRGQACCVGRN